MRLYLDVDALCKCAHWQLLDDLPVALDFAWIESATLTSVKYRAQQCCSVPDGKLFKTTTAALNVFNISQSMLGQLEPDEEVINSLSGMAGIDPGEVTLFSAAAHADDILVLTGDKRALRGLGKQTVTPVIQKLQGKFICLEMLILILLNINGLEWVRQKICPHRDLDRAVQAILGSSCNASEESVREALSSYIKDLHADCVELLAPAYLT